MKIEYSSVISMGLMGLAGPVVAPGPATRRYVLFMAAVVLQGPANSAPEVIVGPFDSLREAEDWAREHTRAGGYSVAHELTTASDFSVAEEPLRLRLNQARLLADAGALRSRPAREETDAARRRAGQGSSLSQQISEDR
jgi:hypothetical protein